VNVLSQNTCSKHHSVLNSRKTTMGGDKCVEGCFDSILPDLTLRAALAAAGESLARTARDALVLPAAVPRAVGTDG
jgi:hypothetical protein